MSQELQTKEILFIVAAADTAGTLHFLNVGETAYPGVIAAVDWRQPLATTIRQELARLGAQDIANEDFAFMGPMAPLVVRDSAAPVATVVVHMLRKTESLPGAWVPVVQLLKQLPATKNRIAYVKAVQFISGGEDSKFQAFDLSQKATKDALLRALQKQH
jgi:hypothetical protein